MKFHMGFPSVPKFGNSE